MYARSPPNIEFDDLVQAGHIGALQASARYEPSVAKFASFAQHRIRGAMRDYMRSMDPLSRTQRREAKRELPPLTATLPPDQRHDYESDLDEVDLSFKELFTEPVEVELPGTAKRLQRAIASLSANEQYVIRAEFWLEARQEQIARALDLTPSRVCQLRKQALIKMRRSLRAP